MKYLKTYEKCTNSERLRYDDCNDSWYWRVHSKYPDILIIFDKLGVPENWGKNWLWNHNNTITPEDFFLFKTKYEDGTIDWSYSGLGFINPDYRKPPIYMGEVEITEDDIKKWKIKKSVQKYNL